MPEHRVLVTGAAGIVGQLIRPRLRHPDRVLRLLDMSPIAPAQPGERVEILTGSVNDAELMKTACADVDAIIHLAGISRESSWADILKVNVDGTHTVLEAARATGVNRLILASSNHAAGFRRVDEAGPDGLPGESTPRPDTYYGFSKAAIEALGSLYHSRFGMDVICIRIGSFFPEPPREVRGLSTWLSPDDGARLLEACLSAPSPGYRVVWGVSNNTRQVFSLREAEELGYRPIDDAEVFAEEILRGAGTPVNGTTYIGGAFTTTELGAPNPL